MMESDLLINQLTETWTINHRINLYLLEALPADKLDLILSSKGRNIGEQFAHIHNVRLLWLKENGGTEGMQKLEKGNFTRVTLINEMNKSADAIRKLFERAFASGKVKGFKPHPAAFLGYLISHESHHRSQVILAAKQSNLPLDKKILFGIWEWGTR